MKLISMVANFACLDGDTLHFTEGLNIIEAPNGSGKSTWCAFLRCMFYGIDTHSRAKRGVPAEKDRYLPWNGKPMEGKVELEYEGQRLILTRTSIGGIPMGNCSIVYADTALPVPGLTGETVGESLLGVGREVYERTAFLRQTGLAVHQSHELERRIAGLVTSGEEEVSWTEADAQLREWQRRRKHHRNGEIPRIEAEELTLSTRLTQLSDLRSDRDTLQKDQRILQTQKIRLEQQYNQRVRENNRETAQKKALLSRELQAAEERMQAVFKSDGQAKIDAAEQAVTQQQQRNQRHPLKLLSRAFLISAALVLVFAFLSLSHQIALSIFSVGAAVLLTLSILLKLKQQKIEQRNTATLRLLEQDLADLTAAQARHLAQLEQANTAKEQAKQMLALANEQTPGIPPRSEEQEDNLRRIQINETRLAHINGQLEALGDPTLMEAHLDELQAKREKLKEEYDAITVALEVLGRADQKLHARFSPALTRRAGEYLKELTDGQYQQVSISRNLEISATANDSLAQHPMPFLSQGTVDQIYLAFRLALCDLILPKDIPLVLDDALAFFDDSRLTLAINCLKQQPHQIILFTCHTREQKRMAPPCEDEIE